MYFKFTLDGIKFILNMYPHHLEERPAQMQQMSQGHSLHQSMEEAFENNLLLEKIQEGISPDIAFEQVLKEFKTISEKHAQSLQNSVLSLKHKTDHIRNDLSAMDDLFGSIKTISRSKSKIKNEKYGQTSASYSRSRYNPNSSKYAPSDFDRKLSLYKKNAEERKSQQRSKSPYGANALNGKSYIAIKEKVK